MQSNNPWQCNYNLITLFFFKCNPTTQHWRRLFVFTGWASTRDASGTSTASPTRLCLWTGCWESLGRRLSSWREWQTFVSLEIYQSRWKIKGTADSLCVCVSPALTHASISKACLIQHSWLPVFPFSWIKKIPLKVCPTSKLAVSRLWSQEINALAASDSVTVHLKNMKENDQKNAWENRQETLG